MSEPTPFEVHESGELLHGQGKADLTVGTCWCPVAGRTTAEVGPPTTCTCRPRWMPPPGVPSSQWARVGAASTSSNRWASIEDDPNVTDKRFPGNPTSRTARRNR